MNIGQEGMQALFDKLQNGVVVHHIDSTILYANSKALDMFQLPRKSVLGKRISEFNWPFLDKYLHKLPKSQHPFYQVLKTGEPVYDCEMGIRYCDKQKIRWAMCNAYPLFDQNDEIHLIAIDFIENTEQVQGIPFKNIVEKANDSIVVTDCEYTSDDGPHIVYTNAAFSDLTGYSATEVLGRKPTFLQGPDTSELTRTTIKHSLLEERSITTEILNYSKQGTPYWSALCVFPLSDESGRVTHFASIARDITPTVHNRDKLKNLSEHDPLTGLLNRRGLKAIWKTLSTHGSSAISIAILDIDYFKTVNDTFGHDAGDELLKAFAQHMEHSFKETDFIGRWGGEEFVIIMYDCNPVQVDDLLNRFREKVSQKVYQIKTSPMEIQVSIGFTHAHQDKTLLELVANADKALYRAKHNGRNRVEYFADFLTNEV